MIEPKIGMQFYDANSGVHTITEVTDEHIIHSYKSGRKVINDAFMYRHVFEKFVANDIIFIINNE